MDDLVYHGTNITFNEFDIKKSIDNGFHFGTLLQAEMRASGDNKRVIPAYLSINKLQRSKDTGSNWKSKIISAKKSGKDGIVYLNRYEGISFKNIKKADEAGISPDNLSDKEFKHWFPEAEDSYIVFDSSQINIVKE